MIVGKINWSSNKLPFIHSKKKINFLKDLTEDYKKNDSGLKSVGSQMEGSGKHTTMNGGMNNVTPPCTHPDLLRILHQTTFLTCVF